MRLREVVRVKLSRKAKELSVRFCDRCGSVCGPGCRRAALRDRARENALLHGWRIA